MANMQIRIDNALKKKAQAVAQGMGLDLSSTVRLFLTQMVIENGLPFRPVASDPFYSEKNIARLKKSIAQMEATGGTLHEVNLDA